MIRLIILRVVRVFVISGVMTCWVIIMAVILLVLIIRFWIMVILIGPSMIPRSFGIVRSMIWLDVLITLSAIPLLSKSTSVISPLCWLFFIEFVPCRKWRPFCFSEICQVILSLNRMSSTFGKSWKENYVTSDVFVRKNCFCRFCTHCKSSFNVWYLSSYELWVRLNLPEIASSDSQFNFWMRYLQMR